MKKKNALLLALALFMGATTASADQKYAGNTPTSFNTSTQPYQTNDNSQIVYIYNVGTKKFVTKGGNWGTQLWLGDDAIPFTLSNSSNSYYIKSNDGYLGLSTNGITSIKVDQNNVYTDRQYNDKYIKTFTYTKVDESVAGVSNAYTIQVNGRYLNANGPKVQTNSTSDTGFTVNANCYWIFVTKQDLLDEFDKSEATNATPVECSFVMNTPGFWRQSGDIGNWKNASGNALSLSTGDNNDTYHIQLPTQDGSIYYYGTSKNGNNYVFNSFYDGGTNVTTGDGGGQSTTYYKYKTTTQGTLPNYYVGNGYGDMVQLAYKDNSTEKFDTLSKAQLYYGGDWTANIHGASGLIYQQKQITLRPGLYLVKCEGFSTDGTGYLFAMAMSNSSTPSTPTTQSDNCKYVAFPTQSERPATYVQAAKLLNNNTGYEKNVIVEVKENEYLTFGAFVKSGNTNSWTCIDNFSIQYLGNTDVQLILDEDQESIDYINAQVNTEKTQTLYLKRSLKGGKWNSIVLPVNLSSGQIKGAFGGDQVKLSKLDRTEDHKIIFEPVSLDSNDKAIEKGQLYIIKPVESMPTGLKEVTKTLENGTELKVGGTAEGQGYYTINMVTMADTVGTAQVQGAVKNESNWDNGIRHCGTYVKFGTESSPAIPYTQTYILSGGTWYYNTVVVNTVKGFRGWIATNQNVQQSTSIVINGVEEGVTAIEGITTDEPTVMKQVRGTYTLSGQKVSDAENTTSLPKGIYIVGGKKVVVK